MRIIAIDDELPALHLLLDAISEAKPDAEVHGFSDPDELIEYGNHNPIDVFAYLICKNGSTCPLNELGGILFEDEPYDDKKRNYVQKIVSTMSKDLEAVGIAEVIRKSYNSISIDPRLIECDYYHYLKGEKTADAVYHGEFMEQYSWSEYYRNF